MLRQRPSVPRANSCSPPCAPHTPYAPPNSVCSTHSSKQTWPHAEVSSKPIHHSVSHPSACRCCFFVQVSQHLPVDQCKLHDRLGARPHLANFVFGGGPKGWGPGGVGARRGGGLNPEKVGARRVGGPKFRAFSLSHRKSHSFFSLWGFSRGILVVFEAPGRSNMRVWSSLVVV